MSDLSELKRRLEEGVLLVPFCTCWLFTEAGRENRNGYGRLWWQGKERMAHILSYEAHVGPVPTGLLVDHKCRVRACINPDHLEPVTPRENTLRGEAKLFGHGRCPITGEVYEEVRAVHPALGHPAHHQSSPRLRFAGADHHPTHAVGTLQGGVAGRQRSDYQSFAVRQRGDRGQGEVRSRLLMLRYDEEFAP